MFVGFIKDVKGYKIWDPKDKKIILNRDVTFDEASMVKLKQVDNEKTNMISQQVESDAIPQSTDRLVSFKIIPEVTHGGDCWPKVTITRF